MNKSATLLVTLAFFAFQSETISAAIITVELTPATSGVGGGRNRIGTPLLHLDFGTSPSFSSGGFLVDSMIANPAGPSFTFDAGVDDWFNEPEEPTINVLFEPSGIEGGSLRVEALNFRDAFELERAYISTWNAQQGFYSSITLKVEFDDPSVTLRGIDFRIDDGTHRALYSTAAGSVPEPSTLAIWSLFCGIGGLAVGYRQHKRRLHHRRQLAPAQRPSTVPTEDIDQSLAYAAWRVEEREVPLSGYGESR